MQERRTRPDDRPYPRPSPDRRNALSRWRSERAPRRSDRHSRKNLPLARRQRLTCLAGRTLKRGPSSIGITLRVASSTLHRSARLRRRHTTVHGSDYRSGDRQERGSGERCVTNAFSTHRPAHEGLVIRSWQLRFGTNAATTWRLLRRATHSALLRH